MNKKSLLSLFLAILTLTGCDFFTKPKNPDQNDDDKPQVETIEKTALNFNFHDFKSNYVNLNRAIPSIGNPKMLVIPVYFSDSNNYITNKENVRNDINLAYFGDSEQTGYESVSSYYKKLSNGKCELGGVVSNWYEVDKTHDYFKTFDQEQTLLNEAVDYYFSHSNDVRTQYDLDQDGYLDAVALIYAAPTYDLLGDEEYNNLWFFTNWLEDAVSNVIAPTVNAYMWGSYVGMYDSSKALERAGSNYGSGNTSYCTVDAHTYIHETGHLFGLQDYYDYTGTACPAGGFSMQDLNVGSHDPFSVMALGWADPYIPTKSCEITINTFQTSHDLILLTNSFNEFKSPFDEYILIELYSNEGLNKFDSTHKYSVTTPQGLNDIGLRVWHVDARLTYTNTSVVNPNNITTNPKIEGNKVYEMMFNSFGGVHASALGSAYYNYNFLQLLRNNTLDDYKTTSRLSSSSLFKDGSYFSFSLLKKQFYKSGLLNSGEAFNWNFDVKIKDNKATLTFNKIN